MTQPAPFSSQNITNLYEQAQEAKAFTKNLANVSLPNIDYVTEGTMVEALLQVWGLDNPEDVIEKFGFKRVVRTHYSLARKAQRGKLPDLTNPAGYFRRTLERTLRRRGASRSQPDLNRQE